MPSSIYHYFAYDGETDLPEEGVADFNGRPHYFCLRECLSEPRTGLFVVAPADPDFLQWVNDWGSIWHEWDVAYHAGRTELSTHPKLPGNNAQFVQLAAQIDRRAQDLREMSIAVVGRVNMSAEYIERMRPYIGKKWPTPGAYSPVLEVTWCQHNEAQPFAAADGFAAR